MPGPLKNINGVSATGNAVRVDWPQAAKSVDKYIIKYRIKGSSDDWKEKETEKIFIEISDLDDGETYEFQVFYEDAGKEMVYTEIRQFSVPSVSKCDILNPQHFIYKYWESENSPMKFAQ